MSAKALPYIPVTQGRSISGNGLSLGYIRGMHFRLNFTESGETCFSDPRHAAIVTAIDL